MITEEKMTVTEARDYAKQILAQCSQCFTNVKARKTMFGRGKWEIAIGGGREACYGRTIRTVEGAEDILRIFAND